MWHEVDDVWQAGSVSAESRYARLRARSRETPHRGLYYARARRADVNSDLVLSVQRNGA